MTQHSETPVMEMSPETAEQLAQLAKLAEANAEVLVQTSEDTGNEDVNAERPLAL